jgi:DNA-binding transcriptional MocR family regulator
MRRQAQAMRWPPEPMMTLLDALAIDCDPAIAIAVMVCTFDLSGWSFIVGRPAQLWSNYRFPAAAAYGRSPMKTIRKSTKLDNVCYDIRGPILECAQRMEDEGHKIIKLNIGNLAVFGFDSPEEIQQDMIRNLPNSAGYSDSKGIFAARKAVMHYTQQQGIAGVTLDDIYLGNGASELIVMASNAMLNDGDEMLIPAPDYPLWTAAVVACPAARTGALPVRRKRNGWMPDLADIRAKVTPRTKGIVVINPNNPTGACTPTICCGASSRSRASSGW